MIVDITPETHRQIQNPVFAAYATAYLDIYAHFMAQVRESGINIAAQDSGEETADRLVHLREQGANLRNDGRSVLVNAISPACVACKQGIGSATFFISLRCHRDCYYCFNPNQVDYEPFQTQQRDLVGELAEAANAGYRLDYLALTGGEPLVHKDESVAFFEAAKTTYPRAHTRLYTTGDQADESLLRRLQAAGLQEIRFSIRMHDLARARQHTMARIALARAYVPTVMVEMPVLPGSEAEMQALLLELDRLQIHSINLLEFCYPLTNAAAFNERGYVVRQRPYQTLYNYWYAGGVPIAGSEATCLALIAFALEQQLTLGVHYCSLENKLTGQNYQQNADRQIPATHYFSQQDYLLKSAKVFGSDVARVYNAFRRTGNRNFERSRAHKYLEFHVDAIDTLADLEVEIGISTSTMEERADGHYLRELKIDLTTPQRFDLRADV